MIFKGALLKIMDLLVIVPDEPYLKLMYFFRMGKPLHLNPPVKYSEKIQYLKIHDHNPAYPMMSDKYEVKKYIAEKAGEQYVVPTLAIWDRAEDIDLDVLPDTFIIKCTHDSGSYTVIKDKSTVDRAALVKKFDAAVRRNFYNSKREWSYHGIKGRIIVEELLLSRDEQGNPTGEPIPEYKFFCFNGVPKLILTISRGYKDENTTYRHFYDENWNLVPVGIVGQPPRLDAQEKPAQFEEMLELAKLFSKDIPSLRVDFYLVGGRVYIGELTFYHQGGFEPFVPPKYDEIFGEYLDVSGY